MGNTADKNGKAIAIIPARGGSKGVPRKNLASLGGVPLIAWSIKAALEAELIDTVVVSTEDQEIAEVAKSFGAEVPFLRPAELATDKANVRDAFNLTLENLEKEGRVFDVKLLLFPTQPFRTPELIDQAVTVCRTKSFNASTVFSWDFQPGFWLGYKDSKWESVKSEMSGIHYSQAGLIEANAIVDGSELGDPRFDVPREWIVLDDSAMLINIDVDKDLNDARDLVSAGEVPWSPVNGINLSYNPKKRSRETSNKIEVFLADNLKTNSSRTQIELEKISSPLGLRNEVDEKTEFNNKDVFIVSSNVDKVSLSLNSSPLIGLSADDKLNVGSGVAYSILGKSCLFFEKSYIEKHGSGYGDIEAGVDDLNFVINCPSEIQDGDAFRIALEISDNQFIICNYTAFPSRNEFVPHKNNKVELKTTFGKDKIIWECPETTLWGKSFLVAKKYRRQLL